MPEFSVFKKFVCMHGYNMQVFSAMSSRENFSTHQGVFWFLVLIVLENILILPAWFCIAVHSDVISEGLLVYILHLAVRSSHVFNFVI